ncbi:disease resistance protein rpp13 [Fagus crenata]
MAAEVPISILLRKLQKLLAEERFIFPGLRNCVVTAVNELKKILLFLRAAEPNHELETKFLRTLYDAEHFTESFLLTTVERPLAFSSWRQLLFSFKMKKFVKCVRAVSTEFGETQSQPLEDMTHYSITEVRHCRLRHNLVDVGKKLVARLINDNDVSLRVISLFSEEALGKTTLARNVYDRQDIQQHFECRAWLQVSGDLEYKDLLYTILKQFPKSVSKDLELMSEKELSDMLFQFLMERRFLIVLDDVQTVDVWLKLVRPFADAVNGSRVILTTRKLMVALLADPWSSPLKLIPSIEQESDVLHKVIEHVQTVARGDAVEKLVARLINDKDESLRVISVVGKEALGKTALARSVYNRLEIRQHFPLRVWLHVSRDLTYVDLLLIILKQLPRCVLEDLELMSEKELSNMLFKFLMEDRFLIVLDDVQTVDVWHKLSGPFADAMKGSRVILTTRNLHVAKGADPWSFLLKEVGIQEYNTDLLNNVREEDILSICDRLPPAILLLGGVLSAIESREWSRVVIDLTHQSKDQGQSPLSKIVDFSFYQLPSVLKPCFLYLTLFPKAYEIPIRRLLHLWLAEGFVQFLPDVSIPEDEAKIYLEELVCRNMIEIARWKSDGSPKTCRMPSFLYDHFLPKAKDIGFLHVHHSKLDSACTSTDSPEFHILRPADHFLQKARDFLHIHHRKSDCTSTDSLEFHIPRLADQFGLQSTSKPHIRKLRSYVSFSSHKRNTSNSGIGMFLKTIINRRGFVLLKVLDLEGVYKPLLPEKLGKLQNLRYIGLRWAGLDKCPDSIGDLQCLETLDLKYTNINTLPSSIWSAKKLRHLYMNEMSIEIPKESSQNLQTLMDLHIGANSPKDYYGLDKFTSLRKLGLTCHSDKAQETAECILQLGNLQTLKLKSRDPFGQPINLKLAPMKEHRSLSNLPLFGVISEGIGNLPQNLTTLTLSMSELKDDPMPVLGKQLPQLSILRLLSRSYVGPKMTCPPWHFPNLRVLKMWKLGELEAWIVEKDAMPQLVELEIRGCKKMTSSDGLEKLPSLKELILTEMPPNFVADVRRKLSRDILLTNEWEFPPSHVSFLS